MNKISINLLESVSLIKQVGDADSICFIAKGREKIIALLSQDNSLSAAALAERIGITPKAVEKHIAKMKAEGILKRIGPDKGGHWQVVEKTD